VVDRPLLIQVVGHSGSGKTLVVERCVRRLVARGLTVGVVKHSHHSPDLRGKDSARFSVAGAHVVLFSGPVSFLTFHGASEELVRALPVDVALVEGFSRRSFGSRRFTIRSPAEVARLVNRIVRVAPRPPKPSTIILDGRRKGADPLWRLVANVMALRGVREVRTNG
jgi:molybdopterin-guanine dinucleotide biosynthesis protein MobB